MARRLTRRPSAVRRPKRKLVWARDSFGVVMETNGPTGSPGNMHRRLPLQDFETTFGANLIGATVMAVRGVISACIIPFDAGLEAYARARVAMRITDHSDANNLDYVNGALYGGSAGADWFFFEPFSLDAGVSLAPDDEPEPTSASEIRHINNRSRRKLEELSETVEMLVDVPPLTGLVPNTAFVRIRWDLSFLIALH